MAETINLLKVEAVQEIADDLAALTAADREQTTADRVATGEDAASSLDGAARAEAARDAAVLGVAGLYPDTTAGLADTVDGEYFSTPSADDAESLLLYRNNSGAATFVKAYPASQALVSGYSEVSMTAETETLVFPHLGLMGASAGVNPTAGTFPSNGKRGIGVDMTGVQMKYLPLDISIPAVHSDTITYEVKLELITNGEAGVTTQGFGLAVGATGSRKSILSLRNGTLLQEVEPTGSVGAGGGAAYKWLDDGDIVKLSMHFTPDGKVYAQQTSVDGALSPMTDVSSFINSSGPVSLAFRRFFSGVLSVRKITASEDITPVREAARGRVLESSTFNPVVFSDNFNRTLNVSSDDVEDDLELLLDGPGPLSTLGLNFKGGGISATAGVHLGAYLGSGEVFRFTTVLDSFITGTPAVGLGFGDGTDAKGIVFRTSGQVFGINLADGSLPIVSGPVPPAFGAGDLVEVECQLSGGTAGDYQITAYMRLNSGTIYGPYVIGGITDLYAWAVFRTPTSVWSKMTLSRAKLTSLFTPMTPTVINSASTVPAWISPSGNDANAGTEASPFATAQGAIASGARELIVAGNDFDIADLRINGDWWSGGALEIRAADEFQPKARGGDDLTGFVATAGRTDVYEATLTQQPVRFSASEASKGFVFVKGEPYGLIGVADRHPSHRGRSHISPHYVMLPAQTMDALEAASDPSWFYDDVADKLYVRSIPGVDPLTMTVTVPRGDGIFNLKTNQTLTLVNIGYEFVTVKMDGVGRYYLESLWNVGGPVDGLSADFCGGGVDKYSSIIGASNDCINVHNSSDAGVASGDGYSTTASRAHTIEPYLAWAFDDGRSIHERALGSVDGGLVEFCGSTGFAPASGAEETIRGTLIRDNGWETPSQAGVSVVNSVIDDGVKTVCYCEGVIVERGTNGFQAAVESAVLTCVDTQTINCSGTALHASVAGSRITARNHRDTGTVNKKGGLGAVVIENQTLVT